MRKRLAILILFVIYATTSVADTVYTANLNGLVIKLELHNDGCYALVSFLPNADHFPPTRLEYSLGIYKPVGKDTLELKDLYHGFKMNFVKNGETYVINDGFLFMENLRFLKANIYSSVSLPKKYYQHAEQLKPFEKHITNNNCSTRNVIAGLYSDCTYCKADSGVYDVFLQIEQNGYYRYLMDNYPISYGTWKECNNVIVFMDKVFKANFYGKWKDGEIVNSYLPMVFDGGDGFHLMK